MQHRNTPLNDVKLSPAQLVFGRPIRDFLPVKPGMFKPSEVWIENVEKRELAMKKRLCLNRVSWSTCLYPKPERNGEGKQDVGSFWGCAGK